MTLKLMTNTGQISPLGIFIAGSRLEDVEICSYAIKTPGTVGWSARRIARSRLGSGDNPLMDIHLAPIWHFTRIRPTYSSALLKVTKYFTFSQASAEEKDCIAREFEMAISLFRQQGI
ncbi:hypothetical protein V865_005414 [Kwoniella europaea PYCC6329]|uniref:Uncharacterized protein n=1 Tax=Kwoniella europaea PYCC6329 TaxID=1423913 RepID=A0AAX4KLE8_9TREE